MRPKSAQNIRLSQRTRLQEPVLNKTTTATSRQAFHHQPAQSKHAKVGSELNVKMAEEDDEKTAATTSFRNQALTVPGLSRASTARRLINTTTGTQSTASLRIPRKVPRAAKVKKQFQ